MKVSHIIIMLIIAIGSVSAQWVRPVASGSAAGGVFTWFGAFNVSDNVTSPVYCIGTYCIDTWPNMSIPGSYLNSSNLTFIRETVNNSGEYNIFINYSNLLNAPTYTNMTDTRWNVTANRYLYNDSSTGNLMFNDTVADNYTWSTDGLVFYAPFNGDALDYSGYGKDLLWQATQRYTTAKYGQSASFQADYVSALSISNSNILSNQSNFSISFWQNNYETASNQTGYAKVLQLGNSAGRIYIQYGAAGSSNMYIYIAPVNCSTGSDSLFQTDEIKDEWNQYTITYNGSMLRILKNGIDKWNRSQIGYCMNITSQFFILSQNYNGTIDEVRIWNRSLSADEVMGLYKMKSEVYPPNSVRNVANMSVGYLQEINTRAAGSSIFDVYTSDRKMSLLLTNNTGGRTQLSLYPDTIYNPTNYYIFDTNSNSSRFYMVSPSTSDVYIQRGGTSGNGGDIYMGTFSAVTSLTGGRTYIDWNGSDRLMTTSTGVIIGNGSLNNPSNGFLEITANLSNISIWAQGDISGNNIIDRSSFPDGESLQNVLALKSDGHGEVDYSTVSDFVKVMISTTTYKTELQTSTKEVCDAKPILDEKGMTTEQTEQVCETKPVTEPVQVVDKVIQQPGRNLGAAIAETEVAIQELYAENCAQMQVFIDKGLLKPEDIKMKHCNLVKP